MTTEVPTHESPPGWLHVVKLKRQNTLPTPMLIAMLLDKDRMRDELELDYLIAVGDLVCWKVFDSYVRAALFNTGGADARTLKKLQTEDVIHLLEQHISSVAGCLTPLDQKATLLLELYERGTCGKSFTEFYIGLWNDLTKEWEETDRSRRYDGSVRALYVPPMIQPYQTAMLAIAADVNLPVVLDNLSEDLLPRC
ncbi:unnamed protein product [Vitrella brassicaformis CCMP3155]|uniref:Uncharacterized protein n=2 Tax=Vitrella brassicaformis TaxID=1169539 RepID=A0A0G4GMI7_VITBC|nr:unnamed protein product [Vitrella brassicaformis CCMP3155]|eukprot:CEM31417.1 unnamed protein product [Vitrella brassicaformis CCMP3155]